MTNMSVKCKLKGHEKKPTRSPTLECIQRQQFGGGGGGGGAVCVKYHAELKQIIFAY